MYRAALISFFTLCSSRLQWLRGVHGCAQGERTQYAASTCSSSPTVSSARFHGGPGHSSSSSTWSALRPHLPRLGPWSGCPGAGSVRWFSPHVWFGGLGVVCKVVLGHSQTKKRSKEKAWFQNGGVGDSTDQISKSPVDLACPARQDKCRLLAPRRTGLCHPATQDKSFGKAAQPN